MRSFLKLFILDQIDLIFETARTGSESVIINLLSLLTVFLLDNNHHTMVGEEHPAVVFGVHRSLTLVWCGQAQNKSLGLGQNNHYLTACHNTYNLGHCMNIEYQGYHFHQIGIFQGCLL